MVFNQKEYMRQYYLENKERITNINRNNRLKNKNKYYAQRKLKRKENPERARILEKEWRKKNKDKMKIIKRRHYLKNKAKDNLHSKIYRETHKNEAQAYQKRYRGLNKEKIKNQRIGYYKDYQIKNKEKIRTKNSKYITKKYHSNPEFRLKFLIRTRIQQCLKNKGKSKNGTKWEAIVGYSKETLKKHLFSTSKYSEKDFLTKPIDIDHKTPQSWFKTAEELIEKGWALENLQLLEREENNVKSNYYCADVMLALSQIGR